ncbi:MAG: hypothetical protein FH758_13740 [Firmicutes bacterium]|nr:hypothetical protein [Bacillota bacterium]
MRCEYHPEIEAQAVCSTCNKAICEQCRLELKEKDYCRNCVENQLDEMDVPTVSGNKSRFLSFILSILPGVGYMYLGLMQRGTQALLLFFGTIFISSFTGIGEISGLLPILIFYSIFDTQQLVAKLNSGLNVQDRQLFSWSKLPSRSNLLGYGLIIVGILAMIDNLVPMVPWFAQYQFMFKRVVPSLAVIALGVYILYRSTRKEATGSE